MTSRYIPLIMLASLAGLCSEAQDTSRKIIEVTSSFKPVLRNAAKINFTATPPPADSSRPRLQYSIPAQNVFPGLSPVALKPLALTPDSNAAWGNSSYVKAGYGNLSTPFLEAGFSVPAGKSSLTVMADHISSHGRIENQDYAQTHARGYLSVPLSGSLQLNAGLGFGNDTYYQYGYDRTQYSFEKSDLRRRYSTMSGDVTVRNPVPNEFGVSYSPRLNFSVFSDNTGNDEVNLRLRVPVEKYIGESLGFRIGLDADLTRYAPRAGKAIGNNLFQLPVTLKIRTKGIRAQAGIIPSWDNGAFRLLPNILLDVPIAGEKWILQAGWLGYYQKGSFQRLAGINPYLAAPGILRNNRITERYLGFRGTVLDHFTYSAKLGYAEFRNVPLFLNDTSSGKSFLVTFEESLKAVQLQGEIGVVEAERFSLALRFNYYKFNAQRTEDRAWGLIPLEFSTNLRWNVLKDLWVKGDLFLWDGSLYRGKDGSSGRTPGAIDMNAGLEFRVMKHIFLWAQFNNLFNSAYQRWNQYDNYGFNMLVGGIYRF